MALFTFIPKKGFADHQRENEQQSLKKHNY